MEKTFYELLGFFLLCIPVKLDRTCVLAPDQDLEMKQSNENKIQEMKTHLLQIPTSTSLNGSVHPQKMKILSLSTLVLFQTHVFSFSETQKEMF